MPLAARLSGLAFAGTAAAHVLAYRLAYPDAAARRHALAASGHADAPWLATAALAGAVAALVFVVLQGRGQTSWARLVRRLVPLQLCCFVLLEVCERWFSGHGVTHLVEERVFVLGLALQIAVALLLASVAAAVLAVVRKLWAPRRRLLWPLVGARRLPLRSLTVPRSDRHCSGEARAPPVASVS